MRPEPDEERLRQPKPDEERLRRVGVSIDGGEGALPPPKGEAGKALAKRGEAEGKGEGKAKTTRKNGEKKAGKLSKYSKVRDREGRGKHTCKQKNRQSNKRHNRQQNRLKGGNTKT